MNTPKTLMNHPNPGVRAAAASQMNSIELSIMAHDECPTVRNAVANCTTNPATLALLAQDESKHVRMSVARNPHTDADTLHVLSKEDSVSIRFCVGTAHNAHDETLDALAHDSEECVVTAVAMNDTTPQDTLWYIVENHCHNFTIMKSVINNKNSPDELLLWLHLHCGGPAPHYAKDALSVING